MSERRFWMVYSIVNNGKLDEFDNYQDAEDEAKRKSTSGDTYVLAPIAYVKQPVPDREVHKIDQSKFSALPDPKENKQP